MKATHFRLSGHIPGLWRIELIKGENFWCIRQESIIFLRLDFPDFIYQLRNFLYNIHIFKLCLAWISSFSLVITQAFSIPCQGVSQLYCFLHKHTYFLLVSDWLCQMLVPIAFCILGDAMPAWYSSCIGRNMILIVLIRLTEVILHDIFL